MSSDSYRKRANILTYRVSIECSIMHNNYGMSYVLETLLYWCCRHIAEFISFTDWWENIILWPVHLYIFCFTTCVRGNVGVTYPTCVRGNRQTFVFCWLNNCSKPVTRCQHPILYMSRVWCGLSIIDHRNSWGGAWVWVWGWGGVGWGGVGWGYDIYWPPERKYPDVPPPTCMAIGLPIGKTR